MEGDSGNDSQLNLHEAVWDDSLLIDAYEKSTRMVNAKIKELQSGKGKKREKPQESVSTAKDDSDIPSADNDMIVSNSNLSENKVQSNEVSISSDVSQRDSESNHVKENVPLNNFPEHLMNQLPPPQPPQYLDDSLASMLMSWYMCGYQTGYYAAKQSQRE